MRTKKTTKTAQTVCANCCAALPESSNGNPGMSFSGVLLCSTCAIAKNLSTAHGVIPVSKWFHLHVDSHLVYKHKETALRFFQDTGQLADWPTTTGSMERGLKDQLVCYGWIMARHMARKLVGHESHMMGRGFEFRDCVAALEKGGF